MHISISSTHKEYRAPTDESVKLLKEFQEKAQKEVIKSVRLDNNDFKAVIQHYRDYSSCDTKLRAVFELNGRREVLDMVIRAEMQDPVVEILKAMSDRIAEKMLMGCAKDLRGLI